MEQKTLDILDKLAIYGTKEMFATREALKAELANRGVSPEQAEKAIIFLDGGPLDDDDLALVSGGGSISPPVKGDVGWHNL